MPGKSTVIKFIIAALDVDPETEVCYCAYTGKAATVLSSKGCPNAITAHKLLYSAKRLANGRFKFYPRKELEQPYRIVVVDEVSMLPSAMWRLLLSHNVYVIAAGDPQQLPPVRAEDDNHVLDNPHVFLNEIMRQAMDSEIIRLSMWIREGKPISLFPCEQKEVQIFHPGDLSIGMLNWADQTLCATNAKRNELNKLVRQSKGFGKDPEVGDKIIGLSNHWDFYSTDEEFPLTNGTIGTITDFYMDKLRLPRYIHPEPVDIMFTTMNFDGHIFKDIPIDYKCFETGEQTISPRGQYLMEKKLKMEAPYDFAYGYVVTTWKAQGSEFPKVLGLEEKFPHDQLTHRRFLYTMCTRPSEKLVVVTKG